MAGESKKVLYAAIAANLAIAVTKFTAAAFTGSSAMISEGIHSLVDTGDGALLLYGLQRSSEPPDAEHPFGYGKELYFWSLIVAVIVFAVGGGVSAYEGLLHVLNPARIESPVWNYAVLGAAFAFESTSFTVAAKNFRRFKGRKGVWEAIHKSKDPTTFTVLFEDSAALLGLMVAFVGIYLTQRLNNPYFDGAASIGIGLILAVVAILLGRETKGLLIGEGADREVLDEVSRLARSDSSVRDVRRLLTMYFGPNTVLLTVEIIFRKELSATEVANAITRLEKNIRQKHEKIKHIFIEATALAEAEGEST